MCRSTPISTSSLPGPVAAPAARGGTSGAGDRAARGRDEIAPGAVAARRRLRARPRERSLRGLHGDLEGLPARSPRAGSKRNDAGLLERPPTL